MAGPSRRPVREPRACTAAHRPGKAPMCESRLGSSAQVVVTVKICRRAAGVRTLGRSLHASTYSLDLARLRRNASKLVLSDG